LNEYVLLMIMIEQLHG